VIYMGVSQAPSIVHGLLSHLPADLPAAAVQHASTPLERRTVTTLGALVSTLARERIGSPAVLVIGRVLAVAVAEDVVVDVVVDAAPAALQPAAVTAAAAAA